MELSPYQIIKSPLVTEKSNLLRAENKYLFLVDLRANKGQIKQAVEELFKVKVRRVYTLVNQGKERRMGRFAGYRSDWKKAIVALHPGQEIKLVEES